MPMAGKSKSWLENQNHGWKIKIMARKSKSWVENQSHGWKIKIVVGTCSLSQTPCSRNMTFPQRQKKLYKCKERSFFRGPRDRSDPVTKL